MGNKLLPSLLGEKQSFVWESVIFCSKDCSEGLVLTGRENDNHSHLGVKLVTAKCGLELTLIPVFEELEECVRLGKNPDSPDLLYTYLDLYKEQLSQVGVEASQAYLARIIDLLIETICDPLVPCQWRALCLDNIHKPVFDLSNLPKTENTRTILRNKTYEIGVLTRHYSNMEVML